MKTHGYEAHSITDRGELSPLGTPDPGGFYNVCFTLSRSA